MNFKKLSTENGTMSLRQMMLRQTTFCRRSQISKSSAGLGGS